MMLWPTIILGLARRHPRRFSLSSSTATAGLSHMTPHSSCRDLVAFDAILSAKKARMSLRELPATWPAAPSSSCVKSDCSNRWFSTTRRPASYPWRARFAFNRFGGRGLRLFYPSLQTYQFVQLGEDGSGAGGEGLKSFFKGKHFTNPLYALCNQTLRRRSNDPPCVLMPQPLLIYSTPSPAVGL